MTQKEINEFLANTKVYVNGKSEEIQKKLFSLGYKWYSGFTGVEHTESPFLFIYPSMFFSRGIDMMNFSRHENREISAEEVLSLELTDGYRPFKNMEECWTEMKRHEPFGWVKGKGSKFYEDCRHVGDYGILGISFDRAYNNYTFADGIPFGIKEG